MDVELIQRINLGVDMNVYSPVLWEESQTNDKKILSYVVIVIIGLILMLVLSSTIYVMMRRCMASRHPLINTHQMDSQDNDMQRLLDDSDA